METKIAMGGIQRLAKQRNLFLLLTLISSSSVLLLGTRLATFDQKVVLVPGISRQMTVSGNDVSGSYLEETALLFLSHLLDISAGDINHKKELVLKYTSYSNSDYSKAINDYFAAACMEYSKFDLSTHFTVKNLQIDQKEMAVVANGVLTSWYGKKGHESREESYRISFEYNGGLLRLKGFERLVPLKQEGKK
jgi:type IV conjugative transfer system protein TraE